ncbi:hypothetical protein HBB16_00995 [Pseudonocardia sp. MCCB 268]|nr:hypothetical protein [Pseudonocardia cytotoxica]
MAAELPLPGSHLHRPFTFRRGELTFELHPRAGRDRVTTPDLIPSAASCTWRLFIRVPNAGNPQSSSATPVSTAALREMAALRRRAAPWPGTGCRFGADRIRQALTDTGRPP